MPFYLPRPRRGTRPTAHSQREVSREIAAARNWEGDGPVSFDATGTAGRFTTVHPPKLMLWEITDEWEACEECTSGSSSSSSSSGSGPIDFPEGWCRAPAIPVLYYDGDQLWEQDELGFDKFIFHPAGYPPNERDDLIDEKIFIPRFSVGDWVWCLFNQQSGWWEILHGFEDIWRFELKTDLDVDDSGAVPQGGTATAYLRKAAVGECDWDACDAITFTVCDSMGMFTGSGRDGGGLNGRGVGSRGLCKWFADSRSWEIIQMECP